MRSFPLLRGFTVAGVLVALTACTGYSQPDPSEPHGIVTVRVQLNVKRSRAKAKIRIDDGEVEVTRNTMRLRVPVGQREIRVGASQYNVKYRRGVSSTTSYNYTLGKNTTTTTPVVREIPYDIAGCGRGFRVDIRQGQRYVIDYALYGNRSCRIQCYYEAPGPNLTSILQPCNVAPAARRR